MSSNFTPVWDVYWMRKEDIAEVQLGFVFHGVAVTIGHHIVLHYTKEGYRFLALS